MFPNIALPGITPGQSATGEMQGTQFEELQKALTAGYGSDVSTLTGGGALRIQSLDRTMMATIAENRHFRLFNKLPKPSATATVDEWTEQNDVGGFLGGSTNSESGVINQATGSYARRVGQVKYLMTMRQVSFVVSLQNSISDAEAIEQHAGAIQLLSDAEYMAFEGNSAIVPTEFDGIYAQINGGVGTDATLVNNMIDARATALTNVATLNKAAGVIAGFGNFGTPTDIFMSQQVQADFDSALDPAFRVPLTDVPGGGIQIGSPVKGIRTSWGDIATNPDVFVREDARLQPFDQLYPAVATAQASIQPASVVPGAPGNDAASLFTAAQAGNYYYAVAGINAAGQSAPLVSAQVAMGAGQSSAIVITRSAGAQETGYVIYRGRQNGTNATSDMREMARIAVAGATTTYTDRNIDIPGTTKAYVLNMAPSANAITWRQLLPMLRFPLYPTNSAVVPWAQLLFGYLRIAKRRHHAVIKNILPTSQAWRPFANA